MSPLARWTLNALYAALLAAASPWLLWRAVRRGKNREGLAAKLFGDVPRRDGDRPCVWLHAVSVGEVNLLATLLRELRGRRPDWEFVVSTTTKTGFDLACKKYGAGHAVFYCPADFSWATDRAMRRVRPDWLVLAELELWPNLIAAAKKHGARVAVVNGRLSEKSFRGYRRVRPLARRVLSMLDVIAAQDDATATRFCALGAPPERVVVTGSMKYDGATTDRGNPRTRELARLAGIEPGEPVWLVGSTQAPEESIAIAVYHRVAADHPELRLVLVPRHPERFDEVAALLVSSGLDWVRRSSLAPDAGGAPRVLLVDSIGELGSWWGVANVGFVGGSFGDRGGQNMIEPAAYGVATSFGPNTKNFRDIVATLLAADAARVVADELELERFVRWTLEKPKEAAMLGERSRRLVASQIGATARTADLLLGESAQRQRSAVSKTP